jgi:hypothetical protein
MAHALSLSLALHQLQACSVFHNLLLAIKRIMQHVPLSAVCSWNPMVVVNGTPDNTLSHLLSTIRSTIPWSREHQAGNVKGTVAYSTSRACGARRPVRQTGVSRIPATAVCMVAFQGEKYVRQTLSDCSGRRKWRRGCLSDGDGGVGGKDILTPHRVSAEVFGGAAEARHVEGETSAPDFCNSTSGAARWPVWWGGAPESSPALGRCPDACDVSEMVQ